MSNLTSLQVEELESLDAAEDEIDIDVKLGLIAAGILFGLGLAIT